MLTRDKDYIKSKLYIKNDKIYTKEKTIIEIPKWYQDKDLLEIADKTYIYGLFAMIIDNKYSVSIVPTLISTVPITVTEVIKDNVEYINFIYGPDDPIIDNTRIVKHDLLSYNLFESFYLQSRIPWFVEYDDLIKIMDNLKKYANSNLGSNYIATELVTSYITRIKENKSMFYRQDTKKDYTFIDLMNVYYAATSTLNKLSGAYFTESLVSAIVQKEETPSRLENLVRQ